MPKVKTLSAKEQSTIQYYCEPASKTFNIWSKSYLLAGYSSCQGWERNAGKVLAKDRVKTAIVKFRKNVKDKFSVTREYCINKLVDIVDDNTSTPRDTISAINVIGDFAGFKRETAPNQEREIARRDIIERELAALEEFCKHRTAQLSQVKQIESKTI